ncbi:MAG: hypothetical protein KF836_08985 [Fimbriimonadaceae bacterium]|nr:hypothetical protein [Fimbriimonadaceae bacterium]
MEFITLAAVLVGLQSQPMVEKNCKVFDTKAGTTLVARAKGDGFAYTDGSKVFLIDENGKQERSLPLKVGNVPIAINENEELFQVSRKPVTDEKESGQFKYSEFKSIGGTLAFDMRSITLFTDIHWSVPLGGSFDGLGINKEQNRILYIDSSGNVPFLKEYQLVDYEWNQVGKPQVPLVLDKGGRGDGVGWAMPQNRFNDVVFLSEKYAAFLGGFGFTAGDDLVDKFVSALVNFPDFRMEQSLGRGESSMVLFIFDIKYGVGYGYGLVTKDGSGERGNLGFGRMMVSGSQKFLYLKGEDKVLQLPIGHVLKSVGFGG